MKKWIYTLAVLLMTSVAALAGRSGDNILEISLSDGAPIVVSIDNRDYNKHGSTITIGDLPRGWHSIRVYEYMEYKRGGARARLFYTGRIKVKDGTRSICVVDVRTQRMRVATYDLNDTYSASAANSNNGGMLTDSEQGNIGNAVNAYDTDTEKLKLMKNKLADYTFLTGQLRTMMGWLAFESSRIEFAKWSYSHVSDTDNYSGLEDVFLIPESKEEFKEFVKAQ